MERAACPVSDRTRGARGTDSGGRDLGARGLEDRLDRIVERRVELGVRPEFVSVAASGIPADVVRVSDAGRYRIVEARSHGHTIKLLLKEGDRVLSLNGRPILDAGQLRQAIRQSAVDGQPQALTFHVERAGRSLDVVVQPVMKDVQGQRLPRIEAALGSPAATVTVQHGPIDGFTRALTKTWDVATLSLEMLGKMLIGEASIKNLSGPITIADYAGRSAELGWVYYVGFLALVSVSLGVLNLLPLPVLDGGHLMYYLFEGVTGRPVSELWLQRLQRGGVAVMLFMMSLALYNDLARILGAH